MRIKFILVTILFLSKTVLVTMTMIPCHFLKCKSLTHKFRQKHLKSIVRQLTVSTFDIAGQRFYSKKTIGTGKSDQKELRLNNVLETTKIKCNEGELRAVHSWPLLKHLLSVSYENKEQVVDLKKGLILSEATFDLNSIPRSFTYACPKQKMKYLEKEKDKRRKATPTELKRIATFVYSTLKKDAEESKQNILAHVDTGTVLSNSLLRINKSTEPYYLNHFPNNRLEKEAQKLLGAELKKKNLLQEFTCPIPIVGRNWVKKSKHLAKASTLASACGPYYIPYAIFMSLGKHPFVERFFIFHEIGHVITCSTEFYENEEFSEVAADIFGLYGSLRDDADFYNLCAWMAINSRSKPYLSTDELCVIGKKILDLKQNKEKIDVEHCTKEIIDKRKEYSYEEELKEEAKKLTDKYRLKIKQALDNQFL